MPLNSTQEQIRKSAARDHAKKITLESILLLALRPKFNAITNDFVKNYAVAGIPPDISNHTQDIQDILADHYDKTAASFSSQIEQTLGEPTNKADVRNNVELSTQIHKNIEVPKAVAFIGNTNQRQIHDSIKKAIVAAAIAGLFLTHKQIARQAGADIQKKFNARLPLIAMDNTANAAEQAKYAEYSSLIANNAIAGGVNFGLAADNENALDQWVAILDGKTRDAHAQADGQVVQHGQPFLVGGEKLRFPRDTGLGASMSNVAGCRCSSVPVIV